MGDAYIKKFTEERELTVMLVVDVSASGEFGSVNLSKRELAAEVACLFAFSAIRNNDKVGCILFSDHVELTSLPPKGAGTRCASFARFCSSSRKAAAPISPARSRRSTA